MCTHDCSQFCEKRVPFESMLANTNVHDFFSLTRQFSNHESCLLPRSHTYAIIAILDLKIHQSMWIHWPFFPKTWTKGHWPLDDLWPHVCWGHMCDSTQGSLCPKSHGNSSMYVDTVINFANYHIYTYTYIHTTYRMSDHIVSYWTQFRRDKKGSFWWWCTRYLEKKGLFLRFTRMWNPRNLTILCLIYVYPFSIKLGCR